MLLGLAAVGFAAGDRALFGGSAAAEARDVLIYVVSNGWHSGVVLPRAAIDRAGAPPEAADFPRAAWLEFGWGDRRFYQEPDAGMGLALRAGLAPTAATLHVVGHDLPPDLAYGDVETVALRLSPAGFDGLVRAISDAFDRGGAARARPTGPGLFGDSRFYDAHGRFHLFNTCNTWTARMLRAGGVEIRPGGVVTADDLLRRLAAASERN